MIKTMLLWFNIFCIFTWGHFECFGKTSCKIETLEIIKKWGNKDSDPETYIFWILDKDDGPEKYIIKSNRLSGELMFK